MLRILFILSLQIVSCFSYGSIHGKGQGSGLYAAGKGFGNIPKNPETPLPPSSTATTTSADPIEATSSPPVSAGSSIDDLVSSTKRFKTLKSRRVEELEEKIQRLKEEEDLLATDPSVGAVPELVANRMITRIAFFFGVPVFGGLSLFVLAFVASKKYDTVVPPYVMAYATQVPFILGLAGITYAILSSSWDEAPGSLLGFEEFKINFGRIKEGLQRTRETNELRSDIADEKEKLRR